MKRKLNKNKTCKICKKKFEQKRFCQVVCSPLCSIKYSKKLADKKWKEIKKEKKESLKTLSNWKEDLQRLINEIVRLIDKDQNCMMCGKPIKKLFACHYHSVGGNDMLRFNLLNIWGGCFSCNGMKGGNIHGYDLQLIDKYGRMQWEVIKFDLTRKYHYIGLSIPEIKEIIPIAGQIRNELKKTDMKYSDQMRWKLREKYNQRLGIYR